MAKPKLGSKYVCASCQTKFYDLGRPNPLCPKCGWNPLETGAARAAESSFADDDDLDDDDGVLKLRAVYEGEEFKDDFDEGEEIEDTAEDELGEDGEGFSVVDGFEDEDQPDAG